MVGQDWLNFIGNLAGNAEAAYIAANAPPGTSVYTNTSTPGRPTINVVGGFSTKEILIGIAIVGVILLLILSRKKHG